MQIAILIILLILWLSIDACFLYKVHKSQQQHEKQFKKRYDDLQNHA